MSVLLVADAVLIAAILLWQGDRIDIGPVRISVRSINNPLTAAWILVCAACALIVVPRVQATLREAAEGGPSVWRSWLRASRRSS